jgi:outer membrane protein TolC
MIKKIITSLLGIMILASLAFPAGAQTASRRVSFADVTTAVVDNNLQIRAAAFDVAVARAELAQAEGARAPQTALSGSYTRTQQQPNPLIDPNVYSAGLNVTYPLSTGGRLEAQVALAQANLQGAQATYDRTRQQLVFGARQLYLQGLLAAENVAAAQRAMNAANESLRVARSRLSAGAASQFDVLQAEVAVANAEQSMVQARAGVASAQASLNATLNLPQDTSLELTDTLSPRPVTLTLDAAVAQALRDRPDLIALRSRIVAAQAGIDLASSGGQPTIGLGAGYGVTNASGQSPYVYGLWSVTLSATMAVFDGGITEAKVREARDQVNQLKTREAQTKQQVELDVRLAWLGLEQAAGRLAAATKAVEQGRESSRLAAARYSAGVGTQLELLSAQSTLAQSELSLAAARFDQNVARIQLILATGSL